MAIDLKQRLDAIGERAKLLTQRLEQERRARLEAESLVADMNRELEQSRRRVAELEQQVEYLRVVGLVDPSREDVARSRAVISELVRDIDRCIADLEQS